MKIAQKIIWDSGFGYELGYYIGDDDNIYNNVNCDMITGLIHGINSYSKSEVIPFTEENHNKMNSKYGYHANKTFNNSFNDE